VCFDTDRENECGVRCGVVVVSLMAGRREPDHQMTNQERPLMVSQRASGVTRIRTTRPSRKRGSGRRDASPSRETSTTRWWSWRKRTVRPTPDSLVPRKDVFVSEF
jgi:hypothetical protein